MTMHRGLGRNADLGKVLTRTGNAGLYTSSVRSGNTGDMCGVEMVVGDLCFQSAISPDESPEFRR